MSHKREASEVMQRVENTKKEITHLKAELEKLINTGISSTQCVVPNGDKENLELKSHEPQSKSEARITFRNVSDAGTALMPARVSRRDAPRVQLSYRERSAPRKPSKSPDCNRKCTYNKEEAREYIKKQQAKRKEQAQLSMKDKITDIETKKKKLKELQLKSLNLVRKNVEQKRKRSKSREINRQTENIAQQKTCGFGTNEGHIPGLIETNTIETSNKGKNVQKPKIDEETEKSSRSSRYKQDDLSKTVQEQMKNVTVKRPVYDIDHTRKEAAKKIQLCFRRYRQKKRNTLANYDANKRNENVAKNTAETQTDKTVDWLNPLTLSNPNNFISTVKRKLNYAITANTPNNKVKDVISVNNNSVLKTPKQEIFQKTKNDIKDAIQKSGKSSKDSLWYQIAQRNIDFDTLKPPEIVLLQTPPPPLKEKYSNLVPKPCTSNKHSEADSSDSDTSKNIPNISTESGLHSNSPRRDKHLSKINSDCDTDHATDIDLSEHKLNTKCLKELKLQRQSNNTYPQELLPKLKTVVSASSETKASVAKITANSTDTVKTLSSVSKLLERPINEQATAKYAFTRDDVISFNRSPSFSNNNTQAMEEQPQQQKNLLEQVQTEKLHTPLDLTLQLKSSSTATKDSSKKSLLAPKQSVTENLSNNTTNNNEYTESFTHTTSKSIITAPSVSLNLSSVNQKSDKLDSQLPAAKSASTCVLLQNEEGTTATTKGCQNEIRLKIEAELHFLNDFNKSFNKFLDLEKSILELRDEYKLKRTIQDSQAKQSSESKNTELSKVGKEVQNINYSRGSDVVEDMSFCSLNSSDFEKGLLSTGFKFANFSESKESSVSESIKEQSLITNENLMKLPYVTASLGMFEQLIKEEDTRIENLKTILKIREKTLLDRTKGELTLLEIQKKHLKETGQLHEASLLKKKQRGVLMRLQHEHHEMQRLKQMQKAASKERKAQLKQQRNMIKAQLSTNNMLTKTKLTTPRENQRQSGPFKVYSIQSHSESVKSETSVSRNSITEEVISVTSRSHSVVGRASDAEVPPSRNEEIKAAFDLAKADHIKKSLLMRETALQKRRRAAEELLQWHKKLTEEEAKVAELEMVAKSIIDKVSKASSNQEHQLNTFLQNMTKRNGSSKEQNSYLPIEHNGNVQKYKCDKFSEKDSSYDSINTDIEYSSDVSSVTKSGDVVFKKSERKARDSENCTPNIYTSDFDTSTSLNNKELSKKTLTSDRFKHSEKIASITELIENLTKINEENSFLSKRSSLNKSIDAEIDKLASVCTETKHNQSTVKSTPNEFKVETNKLLNLKEHLQIDNSKAILDSIDNLKLSIQEITSKAERNRSPKRTCMKSETQSTEKDISDITTRLSDLVIEENIPTASNTETEPSKNVLSSATTGNDYSVKSCSEHPKLSEKVAISKESADVPDIKAVHEKELDLGSTVAPQDELAEQVSVTESDVDGSFVTYSVQTVSPVTSNIEEENLKILESNSENNSAETEVTVEEISLPEVVPTAQSCSENSEVLPIMSNEKSSEDKKTAGFDNIYLPVSNALESNGHSESKQVIFLEENNDVLESHESKIISTETLQGVLDEEFDKREQNRGATIKEGIASISSEVNKKSYSTLYQPQYEDISDVSEQNLTTNADTLNDISGIVSSVDEGLLINNVSEDVQQSLDKSHVENNKSTKSEGNEEPHEEIKTGSLDDSKLEKSETQSSKIDVKKRVSEILMDTSSNKSDRSIRLQDLYVTTYDVVSPESSPESRSPVSNINTNISLSAKGVFNNEAEELLKKQLAIEQEIKQIVQQQKEQLPYVYMREIPNKPPPPYTPPATAATPVQSILPVAVEHVEIAADFSTNVLYNAHLSNTLADVRCDDQIINESMLKDVDKSCLMFLFDVCKEMAMEHYDKFKTDEGPSWTRIISTQRPQNTAFDRDQLRRYLNRKLKVLFGYEKVERRENAIIRWSRKKRDHVDEILVLESQAEESEWTNYDRDELFVKNEVTNEIMNMLLSETAKVLNEVLMKKDKIIL